MQSFFIAVVLWMIATAFKAYAFYCNWSYGFIIVTLSLQLLSIIVVVAVFILWIQRVISLQNVHVLRMDMLTIEEYICLFFFLSTILFAVSTPLWNIFNKDWDWQNRKESTLIFYMAVHFVFSVALTSTIILNSIHKFNLNLPPYYFHSYSGSSGPHDGHQQHQVIELEASLCALCIP